MAQQYPPKKNDSVGYIFYVSLVSQADTKIFQANPTLAAGDAKIAIDDGAPANLGTLPAVDADFTKRVKIVLSQAETNGDNLTIILSDAAGAEWCDLTLNLQTVSERPQALLPAALVSGRMDASVGAMASNALTASAMAADAVAEIADAVWDEAQADHVAVGSFGVTASEIADILVDTAEIGSAGAGLTEAGGDGDHLTAINLPNQTMDIVGNITGNLSGSVGSVTGAVGSVTGLTAATVHSDLDDIQARLPAALTGAGNLKADMLAIDGSTDAATDLKTSALTIVRGSAITGTLSTTQMTTDLTEATDDHYNGRRLLWTSGVLADQATAITDYAGATKMLTYTATTEAPSNGDTFVIV